jgi:nucleotide-binding universal stress UspA family protein
MFNRILCAVDGSDHARKAERLAVDLAKASGATLIFFHGMLVTASADELGRFARIEGLGERVEPVVNRLRAVEGRLEYGYEEPPQGTRVYAEIGQRILDEAKLDAEEAGVTSVETILAEGDPANRILQAVEERGVDCVIMGSRGLSDVRAMILGSVSHKVMNHAPCTAIAVK